MEMKDIILPVGLLVGLLIVLGVGMLILTGNVTDKDTKLADLNSIAISLANEKVVLLADNLQVKTNYNTLLSTHNETVATLTAAQAQIINVTGQLDTMTSAKNILDIQNRSISVDLNTLRLDYNAFVFDTNKIRFDYNKVVSDNNRLLLDNNALAIDRNALVIIKNDMNSLGRRIYVSLDSCYWYAKCMDNNVTPCALKYNITGTPTDINTLVAARASVNRNNCITITDANIGAYTYFS